MSTRANCSAAGGEAAPRRAEALRSAQPRVRLEAAGPDRRGVPGRVRVRPREAGSLLT